MPSPAGIVALVNQKGGPGKTTLAMHLAGTLGRRGERVLVVDTDPQATASRWAAAGAPARPFPAQIIGVGPDPGALHTALQEHLAAYHWIVVDCCQRPSKAAQVWPSKIAHLAEVTSL